MNNRNNIKIAKKMLDGDIISRTWECFFYKRWYYLKKSTQISNNHQDDSPKVNKENLV